MPNPRDLYTDLLVKTLANVIYGDPPCTPGQHTFELEQRENGYDWPSVAHTMAGIKRLENLKLLTQRVLDESVPGDFIETGVWRGGCCILVRGILVANGAIDRKVYVADSFEGLPPPNPEAFPADKGDILYQYEQLAVGLEQVRTNFERYGLLDDSVVFVKGLFESTLPKLDAGPFALIRLDGDMYSSTIVALESLYPKVSVGGFIIIDDYGAIPACKLAVDDFRLKYSISEPMESIDWTGVWWRKLPAERVNDNETAGFAIKAWTWRLAAGGLIQAASGFWGGVGGFWTKRCVLAWKAAVSAVLRAART